MYSLWSVLGSDGMSFSGGEQKISGLASLGFGVTQQVTPVVLARYATVAATSPRRPSSGEGTTAGSTPNLLLELYRLLPKLPKLRAFVSSFGNCIPLTLQTSGEYCRTSINTKTITLAAVARTQREASASPWRQSRERRLSSSP